MVEFSTIKRNEAKAQTAFGKYLRERREQGNPLDCYYELKDAGELRYFAFSSIEPHQLTGLAAMEKHGFTWKLSDQDIREKPCDGLSTPPLPAYLVIKFWEKYYMIPIQEIIKLRDDGIVAIKKDRAEELAVHIITISSRR